MLLGAVTRFAYETSSFFGRYEIPWWDFMLFCWCDIRTIKRWMLKDAGEWVYTMAYWTLRGFVCVCKLGGSLAGGECKLGGGGWSALWDRRVCVKVVLSPACIASSRYVCLRWRNVTWACSCDSLRFTSGFGLLEWCMYAVWRMICLLWAVWVFWSGFFHLLFLRVQLAFFSCDSVSGCSRLQRRPESVGRRQSYHYVSKWVHTYSGEWLDVAWTHAIVIGGFIRGFGVGSDDVM